MHNHTLSVARDTEEETRAVGPQVVLQEATEQSPQRGSGAVRAQQSRDELDSSANSGEQDEEAFARALLDSPHKARHGHY